MSISGSTENRFERVKSRHRVLRVTGVVSTAVGFLLAAYVGYEWVIRRIGHEIIALLSAAAILFGVQLLILSALTSMLITLHREHNHRLNQP